ncbi:MAG: VOC family protein [Actinobacteria bacterium]|nr:VOC family protein [Actinomycetota bacterium]
MKFNTLIPELSVSDFEKSIYFYVKILGFKVEYRREENNFAFLSLNDAQIMIDKVNDNWNTGDLEYPYGRGINFQIEVDDISPLLTSLNENNYSIFISPKDNWYRVDDQLHGNREFLVQDPDGYLLRFSQDIGIKEVIS